MAHVTAWPSKIPDSRQFIVSVVPRVAVEKRLETHGEPEGDENKWWLSMVKHQSMGSFRPKSRDELPPKMLGFTLRTRDWSMKNDDWTTRFQHCMPNKIYGIEGFKQHWGVKWFFTNQKKMASKCWILTRKIWTNTGQYPLLSPPVYESGWMRYAGHLVEFQSKIKQSLGRFKSNTLW